MSDDKKLRCSADRKRVAGGHSYEVKHIAKKLGVTGDAVKKAIKSVGNTHTKIEAALRGKKLGS
jgi:hypothetical protein